MEDLPNREKNIKKQLRITLYLWIKLSLVSSWKKKLGNPLKNTLDLLKETVLANFLLSINQSPNQPLLQVARKTKRFWSLSISPRNKEKVILNQYSQSDKLKTINLFSKLNFGHKNMLLNYQVTLLETNITLRKWWNGFMTGMM